MAECCDKMVPAPGRVKLMEGGLYNVALQRVGSGGEKVGDAAEYLIKVGNTQLTALYPSPPPLPSPLPSYCR